MVNLSEFSYKEAIVLIIGFYTDPVGFRKDELDKIPEVKRFVEMQMTKSDDVYTDKIVLSPRGRQYLHTYIEAISEKFISYMKEKNYESSCGEINRWFMDEFELDTLEDGKEIAEYICKNLYHYGYRASRGYSSRKKDFYQIDRIPS